MRMMKRLQEYRYHGHYILIDQNQSMISRQIMQYVTSMTGDFVMLRNTKKAFVYSIFVVISALLSLQCFDAVSWATATATSL